MIKIGLPQIKVGKEKTNWLFLSILGALMAVISLATDIYLPAMPKMHQDLQGNIELTITGFLIGFSLAQIVWGPISDKYGRRLPLTIGMCLFIIGSIGCALSESIVQIVLWRVFQAVGACTGPMIARAMVRDVYGRTKAAQTLSTLIMILAVAPIVGPFLGGQLLLIGSWHNIFWLLALIGILLLVAVRLLPETLPSKKRSSTSLTQAFSKYKILIFRKSYMRYTLCVTFFYVGAYAFVAGSPAVYISHYGMEPQRYGLFFALNMIGIVAVSALNKKLVKRFSLDQLLQCATLIATIAGVALAICAISQIGGLYTLVCLIFVFYSMNGIIAACATAAALDDVSDMGGAASALLGSLQYGSGIISTILLALFSDGTPVAMASIIAVSATFSALILLVKTKKISQQPA